MKKELEFSLKRGRHYESCETCIKLFVNNIKVDCFIMDLEGNYISISLSKPFREILGVKKGDFESHKNLIKQLNIELYNELFKSKSIWGLKDGDIYYYLNSVGDVNRNVWQGDIYDDERREMGMVFLTSEEAVKNRGKRMATTRVKRRIAELNNGWKPKWKAENECKYIIYYDYREDELTFNCAWEIKLADNDLYLKSGELATKLIEEMEHDLKIMLEVE